eukprot:TRINITY_DN2671_c0_g1_i1.p1 TRINITY_DN2671_c0_g1~~TRINITY_DN2671_c0_g1_i1.p1  ORF type:complete len:308 (+),score=74.92 TRINITY_DN2671_c0_g1_i1:144-1067(+)
MLGLQGYTQTKLPLELQVLKPIVRKNPNRRGSYDVDYTDELNQNEAGKTTRKRRSLSVETEPVDYRLVQLRLETKLENRPSRLDLIQHNIMKEEDIAPSIQAAQQKLKFNRKVDELDNWMGHRPDRSELIDHNIIRGGQIAPNLQAVHQQVSFKKTVLSMEHKYGQRPSYEHLVELNIIKTDAPKKPVHTKAPKENEEEEHVAQSLDGLEIVTLDESDSSPDSKVTLSHKLEHRPAVGTLVNQNILKGNSSVVAPSLHAKQQVLSRHLSNSRLKNTLEFKPTRDPGQEHHDSVGDVVSSMERRRRPT